MSRLSLQKCHIEQEWIEHHIEIDHPLLQRHLQRQRHHFCQSALLHLLGDDELERDIQEFEKENRKEPEIGQVILDAEIEHVDETGMREDKVKDASLIADIDVVQQSSQCRCALPARFVEFKKR